MFILSNWPYMYDKNIIIKSMIFLVLLYLIQSCKMIYLLIYIRIHYDVADLLILYEKLLHILVYIYFYYYKDIIDVLQIFIVYLIKQDFEAKMLLIFYYKEEGVGLFLHQVITYVILWFKMMYLIFSLGDMKEQQYLIKYAIKYRLV